MTTTATTTTATSPTLPLTAGSWSLDDAHTRIAFMVRRLGFSKTRGHFTDVSAEIDVGSTLDESAVTVHVAMDSIDTGNDDRDNHLRSAELLDVARRPSMDYRSTAIRPVGGAWALDGELTMGEITRPLTLHVDFGGVAEFFDGTRHASFEATGEISRKEFGLGFGPLGAMLGDTVKLELDVELVEPS